jgi:hypothetical protein
MLGFQTAPGLPAVKAQFFYALPVPNSWPLNPRILTLSSGNFKKFLGILGIFRGDFVGRCLD